jgi:hypothetical protein
MAKAAARGEQPPRRRPGMRAREASIRHRSGHLVRAYVAFTMLTVRAGTDIPRPLRYAAR